MLCVSTRYMSRTVNLRRNPRLAGAACGALTPAASAPAKPHEEEGPGRSNSDAGPRLGRDTDQALPLRLAALLIGQLAALRLALAATALAAALADASGLAAVVARLRGGLTQLADVAACPGLRPAVGEASPGAGARLLYQVLRIMDKSQAVSWD